MQLVMVFALVFVLKNAAGATLHFSSVSTYAVIPDRKYDVIYRGTSTIATYNRSTLTIVECAGICETASGCGGFNYCDVSGGRTCEALKANQVPIHTNKLFKDPGCFYFHKSVVRFYMSHLTRKPVFGVCDQVRLKPACSATETS